MLPTEAVEHPDVKGRVGLRTLYDALDRQKGKRAPKRKKPTSRRAPPKPAAVVAPEEKPASKPPPAAPIIAERPPEGLTGEQQELWIIDHEIEATRNALAKARAEGSTRTAPLQGELYDLLDRRRKLRAQAEPLDPHEEENRWRLAADNAVKKIRSGVKEARERMAALLGRPFPGDAGVVSRGQPARAAG